MCKRPLAVGRKHRGREDSEWVWSDLLCQLVEVPPGMAVGKLRNGPFGFWIYLEGRPLIHDSNTRETEKKRCMIPALNGSLLSTFYWRTYTAQKGFIVIFTHMHVVYFDLIDSLFLTLPFLWFNVFHYSVFIRACNVLQSFILPPSPFFLPLFHWLPHTKSPPFTFMYIFLFSG